jgi:hypothetical protein
MMNWADARMIKGSHLRIYRLYAIQRPTKPSAAPLLNLAYASDVEDHARALGLLATLERDLSHTGERSLVRHDE